MGDGVRLRPVPLPLSELFILPLPWLGGGETQRELLGWLLERGVPAVDVSLIKVAAVAPTMVHRCWCTLARSLVEALAALPVGRTVLVVPDAAAVSTLTAREVAKTPRAHWRFQRSRR